MRTACVAAVVGAVCLALQPAPAQAHGRREVAAYYYPPATVCPAPVTAYAPVATYYQPVTTYVPVTTYYAPVTTYYAPVYSPPVVVRERVIIRR
jgi:hypothetical protein